MLRAMVVRRTYGVIDGTSHPREIEVGEIIHGDLAAVAIRDLWGTASFEEPAQKVEAKAAVAAPVPGAKPVAPGAATAPEGPGEAEEPAPETRETVQIPADWKTKPWFSVQKWADIIKGEKVKDKAEALTLIQTELDRRAAAAAEPAASSTT